MYTLPECGSVEKHVLLTSLSSYPKDGIYFLDGKTAAANQSPLALLQLLPPERLPQEIIVLCTEKLMKEQFSRLKESVEFEIFSGGRIGV